MEVQAANTALRAPPCPLAFIDEVDLRDIIAKGSFSFDDWMALISAVEDKFPDDIQKISLVYDSFLSEFPLCHGYWKRYAYRKMRLCGCDEAIEVFEDAVRSAATYCVGLWVDYCQFAVSSLEDPRDVRRLFRRAVSFVGKDYLCHSLWDKYIEFEYSQHEWSSVAFIYIQILKFPTKKLRQYYDSFRMLITILKEEVVRGRGTASLSNVELELDIEVQELTNDEISHVIRELCSIDGLARLRALEKFSAMGEKFYEESCQLDGKIVDFESRIRRSYFHVKPLEVDQIENWHLYLDFVEKQSDLDWGVKLYERCLVPAANYPEFWMRYVDFIENKGGREIANLALDRATKLFFKNVSAMRLFDAWFKEKIGDVFGARATICYFDMEESDADFIGNVTAKANMEKRLGNAVTVSNIYKQALDKAMSSRALSKSVPALFVHYSRHLYMMTSNANTAWDVLIDGIRQLPQCKLLYEELIMFATTHGGREHLNAVETVMANALYSGPGSTILDARDAEELSNLYIKFVDQVGSIYDVRKAWMQHVRSFPDFLRHAASANHAQEAVSSKLVSAETRRTCTGSQETAMDNNQGTHTMHDLDSTRNLVPERCDLLSEQPNVAGTDRKALLLIKNNDSQSVGAYPDKRVAEGGANNGVVHATQSRALKQLGHASPNADGSHEDAREAESHRSEQKNFKDSNLQETDLSNKRQTSPSLEKLSLDPSQYQPYQSLTSFYNTEATCEETRASEGIVLVGGSQETRRFSAESWPGTHRTGKVPNTYNRSQDADGGFPRKDRSGSPGFFLNEKDRGNDNRGWQQPPSDKFLRDSKFGPRGQLRKKSNYQQHLSPSSHKQADVTIPVTGQGLSGATNNQQSVNPAAWPMQNLHQAPNFLPQHLSQPSAVGTHATPMFQNPSQSSELQGNNAQNSQAYDVMWQQYYYYQAQQQVGAQQQQQPSIQMTQTVNQSQMHPQQSYDPQQLQHYYQQQQWQFHQQQLQAQQTLQQQQLQAQQTLQQQQLQQQSYNQEQQHQQLQAQQPYNRQQQQYQQLQVQQPVMHQSYDQQQPQQGEPPQDLSMLNLQSKDQVKGEDI